jgi:hypothetical protein
MRHPQQGIPTTPISALLSLLAGGLALAACGDLPSPAACTAAADCPSGAWCRGGQCVADAPPVAVIEPPAVPGSNRPLTFRGGSSHDDDPGDAVVGFAWSATSTGGAGCEPLPAAGAGADFTTVFPCPGDHAVTLVVRDTAGRESAPATLHVVVQPTLDPPLLTAGADLAVEHRCTGTPLTCTPWDGAAEEVALFASGAGPAGVTFTYRWSVELPPELAGQPRPRVTFLPSETVASPRVHVETSGTAIAGRYAFAVAATDSRGMVATARQAVLVGNRPPIVTGGGVLLLPHGFEAGTRRFIATGDTPAATWSDPDGDPVEPVGWSASRANDGGNVFDVQGLGDHARVTVVVPYAKPSDAAYLIGPGVSRHVELTVADLNGGRASTAWDVVVTNRPPRLVSAVASASVDHGFDAVGRRYVAEAPLSSWVDDDGDPLLLSTSGDPACGEVADRGGVAWVACAAPFTGRPDPGRLVGAHAFTLSAADPFEPGPSQATRLEIRNRPPRLASSGLVVQVGCRTSTSCCELAPGKGTCLIREREYLPTTAAVPVVVDDDGDPVDLAAVPSGGCLAAAPVPPACTGADCALTLTTCGNPSACLTWKPEGFLSVAATDGLASVAADLVLDARCPP